MTISSVDIAIIQESTKLLFLLERLMAYPFNRVWLACMYLYRLKEVAVGYSSHTFKYGLRIDVRKHSHNP